MSIRNLTFAFFAATLSFDALAQDETGSNESTAVFNHWKSNKDMSTAVAAPLGGPVTIRVEDTCEAFELEVVPVPDTDTPTAKAPPEKSALPPAVKFEDVFDCVVSPTAQTASAVNSGLTNFKVEVRPKAKSKEGAWAVKPAKDQAAGGDEATQTRLRTWFEKTIAECKQPAEKAVCDSATLSSLREAKTLSEDEYRALLKKVGLLGKENSPDVQLLKPVDFFVYVDETWRTEFAGAFALSDLVNPQFAIRDNVVVRDSAAEDSQSIALAAFVHVSNRQFSDNWALTFGIGVNNASDLNVMFGPSWRMGGAGFITAGYNWGKVDRLPNGQALNAAPINGENTLNGLPKRTDGAWFIGWSFPFLGNARTDLNKPFTPVSAK